MKNKEQKHDLRHFNGDVTMRATSSGILRHFSSYQQATISNEPGPAYGAGRDRRDKISGELVQGVEVALACLVLGATYLCTHILWITHPS